jgi:hypothetical protein
MQQNARHPRVTTATCHRAQQPKTSPRWQCVRTRCRRRVPRALGSPGDDALSGLQLLVQRLRKGVQRREVQPLPQHRDGVRDLDARQQPGHLGAGHSGCGWGREHGGVGLLQRDDLQPILDHSWDAVVNTGTHNAAHVLQDPSINGP